MIDLSDILETKHQRYDRYSRTHKLDNIDGSVTRRGGGRQSTAAPAARLASHDSWVSHFEAHQCYNEKLSKHDREQIAHAICSHARELTNAAAAAENEVTIAVDHRRCDRGGADDPRVD